MLEDILQSEALQQLLHSTSVQYFSLAILALFVLCYATLIFNNLIRLQRSAERAWSNIDVLLKQRHDELKKLINTCQVIMAYEEETLKKLTLARSQIYRAREQQDVKGVGQIEQQLRQFTHHLFGLAEGYPNLSSDTIFQQSRNRVTELEQAISDRREFYNEAVMNYNIRIRAIPDVLIAGLLGFRELSQLEISEDVA